MDHKTTSRDISFVSEGDVIKKSEKMPSAKNTKDIENKQTVDVGSART